MKKLSEYSANEQFALKQQILPDWSDDEINYYLRVCEARHIDPFSGRMYGQKRTDRKTGKSRCAIQPTIDGSREAAARTGDYAGSSEPEYDDDDAEFPKWCRVSVFRKVKGEKCAFTAKVRWKEFCPAAPGDYQWRAKPFHMLAKVAEAQALRKGFPELVGGANEDEYEEEVIENAEPTPEAKAEAEQKAKVAVQWVKAVQAFKALGKSESDMLSFLQIKAKDQATDEHIAQLQDWYGSLINDKENNG